MRGNAMFCSSNMGSDEGSGDTGRPDLVLRWAAMRKENEDTTYTVLFEQAKSMTNEQLEKEIKGC